MAFEPNGSYTIDFNEVVESDTYSPSPAVAATAFGEAEKTALLQATDVFLGAFNNADGKYTNRFNFLYSQLVSLRDTVSGLDIIASTDKAKLEDFLGDIGRLIESGDFETLITQMQTTQASNATIASQNQALLTAAAEARAAFQQTLDDLESRVADLEQNAMMKSDAPVVVRSIMRAMKAGEQAAHNKRMSAYSAMEAELGGLTVGAFDGEAEMTAWLANVAAS